MFLAQLVDSAQNLAALLIPHDPPVRPVLGVGGDPLSKAQALPGQHLVPLAPQPRAAAVDGDPVQPGLKTDPLPDLKARQSPAGADERFLSHVLGVLLVAHDQITEPIDIVLIAPDQDLDGHLVPLLAAADQSHALTARPCPTGRAFHCHARRCNRAAPLLLTPSQSQTFTRSRMLPVPHVLAAWRASRIHTTCSLPENITNPHICQRFSSPSRSTSRLRSPTSGST